MSKTATASFELLCLPLAALLFTSPVSAETLTEAIAAAYESNPQLAEARARQDALAETPEQARAAARPTASLEGNTGYDRIGYGKTTSLTLAAIQPVWTGGRVSSALRAADGEVAAGREDLRDREAAILERVVQTYASVLYNQQAVEVARVGIERLDRQLAEARTRFDLGQATRTDVAQLEAQRATIVANLADAEGALATAAAAYRAVVGHDAQALSADIPPPSGLPNSDEEARQGAQGAAPALARQRLAAQAAGARADQQRAEGHPSVDLSGAYGRGGQWSSGDVRGYDDAASVGLTLTVPILTGGLVASRVRQAEATARAERFAVEAAEREAVRAADTAWNSFQAAQRRLQANVEGLAAADFALKGVRTEYGFGLRTTLDILVADQSYRGAQLAVALSRADVLTTQAALLRASGKLTAAAYR